TGRRRTSAGGAPSCYRGSDVSISSNGWIAANGTGLAASRVRANWNLLPPLALAQASPTRCVMSDGVRRRDVLTGAALALVSGAAARAGVIKGALPWRPDQASPPPRVEPGPWQFFTPEELPAIEAIADRIIPPDPETPGGRDAGCVVFLDRQLAGPYGHRDGLYVRPPFQPGAKNQGSQSEAGPAQQYRMALAALDRACKA